MEVGLFQMDGNGVILQKPRVPGTKDGHINRECGFLAPVEKKLSSWFVRSESIFHFVFSGASASEFRSRLTFRFRNPPLLSRGLMSHRQLAAEVKLLQKILAAAPSLAQNGPGNRGLTRQL